MLWWECLGRLKWRATGLDASVLFCSASRSCSRKRTICGLFAGFTYTTGTQKAAKISNTGITGGFAFDYLLKGSYESPVLDRVSAESRYL